MPSYSVFWSVQYICAFVHILVRLYTQSQLKSIGLLPTELPIKVLIVDQKILRKKKQQQTLQWASIDLVNTFRLGQLPNQDWMCSSVLKRVHSRLICGLENKPHWEENKWVSSFAEPGEIAPAVISPLSNLAEQGNGPEEWVQIVLFLGRSMVARDLTGNIPRMMKLCPCWALKTASTYKITVNSQ